MVRKTDGRQDSSTGRVSAAVGPAPADVRSQVARIVASEAFANCGRLKRFLQFTVEETLAGRGEELKEYRLGVEACGRDPSYDPRTDPIVRVEAGRLRNKLSLYYEREGREDPIRIELRRGGYVPVFRRRDEAHAAEPRTFKPRYAAYPAILAIVAVLGWIVAAQRKELAALRRAGPTAELRAIWGPFLEGPAPNTAVFGSPLFFGSERYRMFLRLYGINDPQRAGESEEFARLQKQLGDLIGPRYDYASMGDAIAVPHLANFFGRFGRGLRAVPAHAAAWDELGDNNLIFVGLPRMNPLLQRLPIKQDFQFGPPDTHVYNLNPRPGEEALYTTPSHRDALTYAVIASFPGLRPNREIMLLLGHHSSGLRAAVDYVTNPDTARALVERVRLPVSGSRRYYQLLLRVHSDRDTAVKAEYVTHHLVTSTP